MSIARLRREFASLKRHGFNLLAVMILCFGAAPVLAEPLRLGEQPSVDLWPVVTVLHDAEQAYDVTQLADQSQRFSRPGGTAGNLGRQAETVWLRIPLHVEGSTALQRVLEIDYPPLNRVDLYLLRDGRVQLHRRMGNQLLHDERAMPTRTHSAMLPLVPGEQELLLRVHTHSSMVLPITLRSPEAFVLAESRVQLVQGLIVGLALCMLLYSLSHWMSLRDAVFLDYSVLLLGNIAFTLSYFGIGSQYFWSDSPTLATNIAPISIMVAVAAGTRFVRAILQVREVSRIIDLTLRVTGALALAGLVGMVSGMIDYRAGQALVTVLGLVVTCVILPVGAVRVHRGERSAFYMLLGWAFYSAGALTMAGLLRGLIVPTFWTQHVYPFATMIEMAAWMTVLSLRVQLIRSNADRTRVESETLRKLANADALTGLPNRRGLQEQMITALRTSAPDRMLAIYLIDLDDFKPINDRYGHDVGDAVLIEVGKRLRGQLRAGDQVARLGGDEFVVLAASLPNQAAAQALGSKLLAAFATPLQAAGESCQVGLTIGYAIAPLDGTTVDELLKRADTAMYAGKRHGRGQVQRGGRVSAGVSGPTTA